MYANVNFLCVIHDYLCTIASNIIIVSADKMTRILVTVNGVSTKTCCSVLEEFMRLA